jgi:NitT/TauT family transport system permease protein
MQQDRRGFVGETVRAIRENLARVVPPVLLIGSLIAVWWIVVARSDSAIFPTPGQVASGAWALAQDGTLWEHIESSLFRVEMGFGLAFLVAVPLGLWMGWVSGAFYTLNPLFQMLRPI